MDDIMGQLIDLGAGSLPKESTAATLEPVVQDGVAPDDFYVTTIYPTEVLVGDHWYGVQGQRMDGAIAITKENGKPIARCKLQRD